MNEEKIFLNQKKTFNEIKEKLGNIQLSPKLEQSLSESLWNLSLTLQPIADILD